MCHCRNVTSWRRKRNRRRQQEGARRTSSECSAISLRACSSMASGVACACDRWGGRRWQLLGNTASHTAAPLRNAGKRRISSAAPAAPPLRRAASAALRQRRHPSTASPSATPCARAPTHLGQLLRAVQRQHILHSHVSWVHQQAAAQPVAHLRQAACKGVGWAWG